jgi:hypothetical protein
MLPRYHFIFYVLIFCLGGVARAQEKTDSMYVSGVYKKIEDYSTKRKFTSLVHYLLLKPVITATTQPVTSKENKAEEPYKPYEGKIIRNIHITTLDPFGYSVRDTNAYPRSYLEKSGNTLHIKTLHFTIRNQLLIHANDRFDSLLVKESERLVRGQSYINDVVVRTELTLKDSDSVDIFIRVSDLWSIEPDGDLSNSHTTLRLTDRNLGGLGHTFSNSYTQNYLNGENAFSTSYYIPNIKNSYVSSWFGYAIDENKDYQKSLKIERPFFSPVARWAGGVLVSQQKQPAWIYINDTTRLFQNSTFNIQDYWAAMAWQIFKGKSETNRSTKLILSGRAFSIRYLQKPGEHADLLDYYTNERFYLWGLGVSSRKYVKKYYIFRFGRPEDVPVGLAYGVTGGYRAKNTARWYWGLHHSWGNFFKWGYFGTHIEYGAFIDSYRSSEEVLTASINYFSGLITIGNWKFRQFVKPELTIGFNRASYDRLTLNDGYGLNGFSSDVLSGTRRCLIVIQTQSYAPWNVLGFRFGPYINLTFGMLGNEASGFSHSRVYPQLGFGVLIKNDYLVIKYFQLSFAFYPAIPGDGTNVFKANPFRTTDFGFQDFIIGKPDVVEFR